MGRGVRDNKAIVECWACGRRAKDIWLLSYYVPGLRNQVRLCSVCANRSTSSFGR